MKKKLKESSGITLIVLILIIVGVFLIIGGTIGYLLLSHNKQQNNDKENQIQTDKTGETEALAGVYLNTEALTEVEMGYTEEDDKKIVCSIKMPIDYWFTAKYHDEVGDTFEDFEKNDADERILLYDVTKTLKSILEETSLDQSTGAISEVTLRNNKTDRTAMTFLIENTDIEAKKAEKKDELTELGTQKHPAFYYIDLGLTSENEKSLRVVYQINEETLLTISYEGELIEMLGEEQLAKNMYELVSIKGEEKDTQKVSINKKNNTKEPIKKVKLTYYTDIDSSLLSVEDAGIEKEGNVVIPESITYNNETYEIAEIGYTAFEECTELESISLPDSVTNIGNKAFKNCTKLREVKFSNNLLGIGESAFWGCEELEEVKFPIALQVIEEKAFVGCSNLKTIELPQHNNEFDTLSSSVFEGCSSLEEIEIPKTVQSIYLDAFNGCTSLKSITIPKRVKELSAYVFSNCNSLEKIEWNGETYTDKDEFNEKFAEEKTKIWT